MAQLSEERILGIWLPVTAVAAMALTLVALATKEVVSAGTTLALGGCSGAVWLAVVVELMLVYEALVERWFSKDRSVWATAWFVISLALTVWLTPDKDLKIATFAIAAGIFAVLFFLPYFVVRKFYKDRKPMLKPVVTPMAAEATKPLSKQEEEKRHYREAIDAIPAKTLNSIPELLRTDNGKFLFVLFRESDYLDEKFMPTKVGQSGGINQSLYSFVAHTITSALRIKMHKWPDFESWWRLNEPSKKLHDYKQATKDKPNEDQKHIAIIMRKATRLRPELETSAIRKMLLKY